MSRVLLEMHRAARAFYGRQLLERPNGWAVAHLRERGFEAVLGDPAWWVGYAPSAWTSLTDHLRGLGFADQQLIRGGLSLPTMNGYLVDRFRDRIVFAAENIDFETVGFVGRGRGRRVRYLNTAATDIHQKSKTVVGLTAQRGKLLCGAIPVFVEGPLDALAVDLLGGRWAGIAVGGTSITAEHAAMIRQVSMANQAIVALDPDTAGRLGAVRSLDVLTAVFGSVRVAELPAGEDPASVYRTSKNDLVECLGSARLLVEFAIDVELAKWDHVIDHLSGQVNALRAVAHLVRQLPSDRMAHEVATLADRLNLEVGVVSREVLTPVLSRRGRSRAGRFRTTADLTVTEEPRPGRTP